jgi:glycosyltransferase involved in cell wall biosynthesis
MKILFDVSGLDHEQISGVGTYVYHLARALKQRPDVDVVGSWKLSRYKKLGWIRQHANLPLRPFIPGWSALNLARFDVFHGPDFRVPPVRMKKVVTIHDLAFFEEGMTSEKFAASRRQLMDDLIKKVRPEALIAVSQYTRKMLIERYPEYEPRTFVVYHGADHLPAPGTKGARPFAEPYFLFVGNIEARKNVGRILRAFDLVKTQARFRDFRMVLIGKPGFDHESIVKVLGELKHREHVLQPGFVPNAELVSYYQNAEAFVYPSLHEGFGFPILEAMRLRCPVITSNTSAAAEVAGGGALRVNPLEADEIAGAMTMIVEDNTVRHNLIKKGVARGAEFLWSRCAEATCKVYAKAKS